MIAVELPRAAFGDAERAFLHAPGLQAGLFRYSTGVEAVRLANARGHVLVLPFLGGIVWDAAFDGVRLGMDGMFAAPRPSAEILGTYSCLLYHAGLLRNGNPGPEDTHALHGEMPCALMDSAALEAGEDQAGPFLRLRSRLDYARGFANRYRAEPTVTLRPDATSFDVGMQVENVGGRPMDLMYMAHANFAFAPGARIVQPAPWTPAHVVVRTAVPGHVQPTPAYAALLEQLARDSASLETLDDPDRLALEQVFYLRGLQPGADGRVTVALHRREGDGFAISWPQADFSHCVRWLLYTPDEKVAAIALPSTCEPEGYTAERRKGNVRTLAPGDAASFAVRLAYLPSA